MKIAVVGVGMTKFGEHWDKSLRDLAAEAGHAALHDSTLPASCSVDALFVGNMSAGRFAGQEHVAALVADWLGMRVPAARCEAACASGALAFRQACLAIRSGACDVAMALGVEKMTDLTTDEVTSTLMAAGDQEWEASIGMTFAGLYGLIARAHMHKYGTTPEQLALVSVNNHKNSVGNAYAQYPFAVTKEDVMNSGIVADPLRLLDCSPITDGAAAVVLASERIAKQAELPVWVLASEQAGDTLALHDRASLTEMLAVRQAAKAAFAAVPREKIDVAEVHDCFSINEIINLEDLGFCKKGSGGSFVESGAIALDGSMPTNTTGGLKAIGHPVGATGIRQIIDIAKQLRGESHNQISDAAHGLCLNVGGSGATAVLHILSKEI